jgi:hypothetical protein
MTFELLLIVSSLYKKLTPNHKISSCRANKWKTDYISFYTDFDYHLQLKCKWPSGNMLGFDVMEASSNPIYNRYNLFNPSNHSPFFPCRLTASGRIEPGSSGHMWPGRETEYPFSPPPHRSCRRALNMVSIVTISFNIVSVACQVGN